MGLVNVLIGVTQVYKDYETHSNRYPGQSELRVFGNWCLTPVFFMGDVLLGAGKLIIWCMGPVFWILDLVEPNQWFQSKEDHFCHSLIELLNR